MCWCNLVKLMDFILGKNAVRSNLYSMEYWKEKFDRLQGFSWNPNEEKNANFIYYKIIAPSGNLY